MYTLQGEKGRYLSATATTLTTNTTATSANEQFLFYTAPATAETSGTKAGGAPLMAAGEPVVYLYSVGQQKFLSSAASNNLVTPGTAAAALRVYTTDDPHGYSLAFGFGTTWTDGTVVSTSGVTATTTLSEDNRFKAAEVAKTETELAAIKGAADRRLNALPAAGSRITAAQAGITLNTKVYTINAVNTGEDDNRSRGSLKATATNAVREQHPNAADANQQFVFLTKTDGETEEVYLYSVGQENIEKVSSTSLKVNEGTAMPVYFYSSGNYDFPLGFAFSKADNYTSSSNRLNISGGNIVLGSYNWDNGNQWNVVDVTGQASGYDLTAARTFLSGSYGTASAQPTGLTTDNKVYTLKSESGNYLSATTGGLGGSATNASANEQFLFFSDPTANGKVYLYSVGRQRFLTSTKGWTTGGTDAAQVYTFSTNDNHHYNLAFGLNETWTTGPAINVNNSSSTVPDRANRFMAAEVTELTAEAVSAITAEAARRFSPLPAQGTNITAAQAGITLNTVVYTINAINTGSNEDTKRGSLKTTETGVVRDQTPDATDPNQQFVFLTRTDEATDEVYLYSVGQKKVLKVSSSSLQFDGVGFKPINFYSSGNYDFPLGFTFTKVNSYFDASDNLNISSGTVQLLNSRSWDNGNQFRLSPVAGAALSAADLQYARNYLQYASEGVLSAPLHYRGYAHKHPATETRDFKRVGTGHHEMQDVSEVHYYYYVSYSHQEGFTNGTMPSGHDHAINLPLPFYNYLGGFWSNTGKGYENESGNSQEPKGYFRWYDYNTDAMPAGNRIEKRSSSSELRNLASVDLKSSVGYIGYNLQQTAPTAGNVGVVYNIPAEADNADWPGDVIACDVSRYTDYNVRLNDDGSGIYDNAADNTNVGYGRDMTGTPGTNPAWSTRTGDFTFRHEPTLSIRYVFHILPRQRVADEIKSKLIAGSEADGLTLEDDGVLVFGNKTPTATMNLRANIAEAKFYYFYPMTADALTQKHVYYTDGTTSAHDIDENSFDPAPVQATGFEWRVYDASKTWWRTFRSYSRARSFAIQVSSTNAPSSASVNSLADPNTQASWYHELTEADGTAYTKRFEKSADVITQNSKCYIVGYLVGGENNAKKCPFYNAELQLNSANYPMSTEQIASSSRDDRTEESLRRRFGSPKADFTFDDENELMTTDPAKANVTGVANYLSYPDENYSLVPSPFAWRQFSFVYKGLARYDNALNNYMSVISPYHGDFLLYKETGGLHDVTYEKSGGARNGFFLFTDASNESRTLGYQDFDATLCGGTKLYMSAYVANLSSGEEMPEVRFKVYALDKDAQDEYEPVKCLVSVCSGKFNTGNIDGWTDKKSGPWYQVYGEVTLPMSYTGYNDISRYRVYIDNYCNSTEGADYAIDDIVIFQSPAKLTVIQPPAVCEGGDGQDVTIKIKGDYESLHTLAGGSATDQTVYYRFYLPDGTPVTGQNFYGAGHSSYGQTVIPGHYDATLKMDGYDDAGETPMQENRFEGISPDVQLLLVDSKFALRRDSSYYVSLAYAEPEKESSWGRPSSICDTYSTTFSLVAQELAIDGVVGNTATVTVECGEGTVRKVNGNDVHYYNGYQPVNMTVTAPDKRNGGTIVLSGIHFDWYLGSDSEFEAMSGDNSLDAALRRFRDKYPTAVITTADGLDATGDGGALYPVSTVAGEYSESDKALIRQAVTDGKLWLSASSSLSDFLIPLGKQELLAVPTQLTVVVKQHGENVTYRICDKPRSFVVQALQTGPGLTLGIKTLENSYPASRQYRYVRVGLPQLRNMAPWVFSGTTATTEGGTLRIPIINRKYMSDVVEDEDLLFTDGTSNQSAEQSANRSRYVLVSATNDPTFNLQDADYQKIAEVAYADYVLSHGSETLNLCNVQTDKLHEGYWYELQFNFRRKNVPASDAGKPQCDGSTFLYLEIVPEYVTWSPTADNYMNTNWNNDQNWTRSTAADLYKPDYTDYRSSSYSYKVYKDGAAEDKSSPVATFPERSVQPASYTPMYFTKVTIPKMTGRPYPMLGFIRRQAGTNLILRMQNDKHHDPTDNIQFDLMAVPIRADGTQQARWTEDEAGHYGCVVFDGNLCEQVLFKPGAELRNQQFLVYNKAWVETEMPVGQWQTFATPMDHTLSGDFYVPRLTGRQTTEAFKDITFEVNDEVDGNGLPSASGGYSFFGQYGTNKKLYSRLRLPFYQKLWGLGGKEYGRDFEQDDDDVLNTYDNPYAMVIYPDSKRNTDLQPGEDNSSRNTWSHTFNALGERTDNSVDSLSEGVWLNGKGVAIRVGDDYATPTGDGGAWKDKAALVRLPKADTQFWFYKYGFAGDDATKRSEVKTGKYQDVSAFRTTADASNYNYRLGIPYSNDANAVGQRLVNTSPNLQPDQLAYELVGNPYTSSISVREFVRANRSSLQTVRRPLNSDGSEIEDVTRDVYRVWVLSDGELLELDTVSSRIASAQAFFVKLKTKGSRLVFTTDMQVDPTLGATEASLVAQAEGAAKVYTVNGVDDIQEVIDNGRIAGALRLSSPAAGWLRVHNTDSEMGGRAAVYTTGGQLVRQEVCAPGAGHDFQTGSGIFVVRLVMDDGRTKVKKVMVR